MNTFTYSYTLLSLSREWKRLARDSCQWIILFAYQAGASTFETSPNSHIIVVDIYKYPIKYHQGLWPNSSPYQGRRKKIEIHWPLSKSQLLPALLKHYLPEGNRMPYTVYNNLEIITKCIRFILEPGTCLLTTKYRVTIGADGMVIRGVHVQHKQE